MKKVFLTALVSFILGIVFSGIVIYWMAPGLMLMEN